MSLIYVKIDWITMLILMFQTVCVYWSDQIDNNLSFAAWSVLEIFLWFLKSSHKMLHRGSNNKETAYVGSKWTQKKQEDYTERAPNLNSF